MIWLPLTTGLHIQVWIKMIPKMTDLSLAGIHWALSSDPGPMIRNQARPAISIHSSFLPNDLIVFAKLVRWSKMVQIKQPQVGQIASHKINKNVCSSDMTGAGALPA